MPMILYQYPLTVAMCVATNAASRAYASLCLVTSPRQAFSPCMVPPWIGTLQQAKARSCG